MNKNTYEKQFEAFLDLIGFALVKYYNGWGLKDNQEANIGDIDDYRFYNATMLIDALDIYIEDYLVDPIEKELGVYSRGMTWGDFAKKHIGNAGECEIEDLILDALCNHPEEINLENCNYKVWKEKIYTLVCRTYTDGVSTTCFHRLEDSRSFVNIDSKEVEIELHRQGYDPKRIESYMCVEIYVPNTDIFYEWFIDESDLY